MTRHLPRPGLSRRGLLKGASALGASSLLLPFGMQAAMAQPRSGGVLRVALAHGTARDGYDPAQWDNDFSALFAMSRNGYLTEIGSDGQLTGEIAERWSTTDAVQWVLKIRSDVTFHSGKALVVDDVIVSLNHHRGTTSAVAPLVSQIMDLRADGWDLIVTLAAANVDFPLLLADYHLPVLPAVNAQLDIRSADGCGAYRVNSYCPGVAAILERNPNYWKAGRAHFNEINILTLTDSAKRATALQNGSVDLIDCVDPAVVPTLQQAAGLRVALHPDSRHVVLAMDSRTAPFHDKHMRLALKAAVDRDAIVDDTLRGFGKIGNDHPIAPTHRFFNADLPQAIHDPDLARYHLRKAGLTTADLTLVTSDAACVGAVQMARSVARSAETSGIDLTVHPVDSPDYWGQLWRQSQFCTSATAKKPTEDWIFSTAYAAGAPWNDGHWVNDRFDRLLHWARSELIDDRRRDMYWEMQAICAQDGAVVIPVFADGLTAYSHRLMHDAAVVDMAALDGFRMAERWWFA